MGDVWLNDLPNALMAGGVDVRTWPGWETNSRSSGGLEALLAIGVHHDASNPSTSEDELCRYHAEGSSIAPVGSLNLARNGRWTVIAAGATNTQGTGGPVDTSRGRIQAGNGNLWFLSIEANNNGVGEPWPDVMVDSYVAGVGALCEWYDLAVGDVFAHFEWTNPDKNPAAGDWGFRKIDPAGPCRFALPDTAHPDMWNMDAFRGEVWNLIHRTEPEPEPEPEPEDPHMPPTIAYIAVPPDSRPGQPWLLCIDAGVRYATNPDTKVDLPFVTLNEDQYDWLLKSAGLG